MINKDGTIPDAGMSMPSSMEVLIQVGITPNWQVAVFWPNDRLRHDLLNRLTPSELRRVKDAIITAFNQSVDKRLPTIINIS